MTSWIEGIVARYYQKQGFFVITNYPFFIPREKTGKKVGGWSDIDVLAYNGEELHILQCKPFLGRREAKKEAGDVLKWFDYALEHLSKDNKFKHIIQNTKIIKRVVLQSPQPKKAIKILEDDSIEVIILKDIIKELINIIKNEIEKYKREGRGRIGKEDDILLAFIRELILTKIIN